MTTVVQETPTVPMETVTRRAVSSKGKGPYYVYLPGFTVYDLMRMTHSFAALPAGQVFLVKSGEDWYEKHQLDELTSAEEIVVKDFFGHEKMVQRSIEIPAEAILDSLLADRALTTHNIAQISSFAQLDVDHLTLNRLIQPEAIPELSKPREWRQRLETEGMLHIRQRWLEEAAEALETGRMLEDIRRVIDARPMLRDLWLTAVTTVLLPAVEAFNATANTILAQKEEAIRSGQKAVYDTYDQTLMWLLGRKPERTALSRTLEEAGKSGVGIEEIRALVKEIVSATSSAPVVAREQVQCVTCGEFLNMVAGGPPQKCRHCGHEFYASAGIAAAASADTALGTPISNGDGTADDSAELADQIMGKKKR